MNWIKNKATQAAQVAQQAAIKVQAQMARVKDEAWEEPENGTFMHGTLHVVVHEAKDLPNTDRMLGGLTDAYVRVLVDGKKGPRTNTVRDNLNPSWEEELYFRIGWKVAVMTLKVKDDDAGLMSQSVGVVDIPIGDVIAGKIKDSWFKIGDQGELKVTAHFVDAKDETAALEVPSAFHKTTGNRVTLFQDAHVPHDTHIPDVPIATGIYNKYNCAWESVYDHINKAEHFIYIAGWSVWADLQLLREKPLGSEGFVSLGDLLKKKADSGVTVLVLIWNELLSLDNRIINNWLVTTKSGILNTHDEETRKFFQGSKVCCQLALRHGRGITTLGNVTTMTSMLSYTPEALFTHHQKTVICDTASEVPGKRRVVAFVGGLDLTSGRFDTQEHPIFRTLETWHKKDFYQGYGKYDEDCGPRQPWHDIHSFVDGPVAYDVMKNFEQRWTKQATKEAGRLVNLMELPFLTIDEHKYEGPGTWNCQLFRSIDSYSAVLHPEGIERGIYDAYIYQIRRAENFIYIENQYFLGSSQEWQGFDERKWNVECKHRIPAELATKVVAKIRAGERFAIYLVIPMHPEGVPEDPAMQAILHWQYKTVSFMYKDIAQALKDFGPPDALPTDYFNVYFPAQREPGPEPEDAASCKGRQANQLASRRHMIYVHSKTMIVDDEYIIVGTANINERSMAGDRDTEICVGMYQPDFICEGPNLPRGQVSGFRLSLWGEHTGVYEECFHTPQSVECVRRVNQIAEANWATFAGDEVKPLASHLCKYPYVISKEGDVEPIQPCFPDMAEFKATIIGAPQMKVPNIITT